MICAWIETSSAETGSSQTISFGLQRERPGDADALPLAAGELGREPVVVLGVEPDELHQLLDRGACAPRRRATPWIANGSPMIEPTRRRGFSEPYGSWKIICISRRYGRSCRREQRGDVVAVEHDLPGRQRRAAA